MAAKAVSQHKSTGTRSSSRISNSITALAAVRDAESRLSGNAPADLASLNARLADWRSRVDPPVGQISRKVVLAVLEAYAEDPSLQGMLRAVKQMIRIDPERSSEILLCAGIIWKLALRLPRDAILTYLTPYGGAIAERGTSFPLCHRRERH